MVGEPDATPTRRRDPALAGTPIIGTTERLRDGPLSSSRRRPRARAIATSLQWRGEPRPVRFLGLRHLPEFGASASWTASTRQAPGRLDSSASWWTAQPARVWQYTTDGGTVPVARQRARALGDQRDPGHVPRRHRPRPARGVDRRRLVRAKERAITWRTLSPSILGTYRALNNGRLTFLAGYARYASRLPLNYLAFGDPHGLTGVDAALERRQPRSAAAAGEVGRGARRRGPVLRQRPAQHDRRRSERAADDGSPRRAADAAVRTTACCASAAPIAGITG